MIRCDAIFHVKKGGKQFQRSQLVLADLSEPEICQKFAAHCAGNVSEEFAANCVSEKKLHMKIYLQQIFTAKLQQAFSKIAATVCRKAFNLNWQGLPYLVLLLASK